MDIRKNRKNFIGSLSFITILLAVIFLGICSCGNPTTDNKQKNQVDLSEEQDDQETQQTVTAFLVSPKNPKPGQVFQVLSIGRKSISKAKVEISTPNGLIISEKTRSGEGFPYWRIDKYKADSEGKYQVTIVDGNSTNSSVNFDVVEKPSQSYSNGVWKSERGWDAETEALYSAWVNVLFYDSDERSSWTALHEVTQNRERNFLYNHLSLSEDDSISKNRVQMEPDCADCPYYLRAYFAWKLGLPFGFHECDRGYLGRAPQTGRWITNELAISRSHPVQKFNAFLRMVMNGVHSGSARTAFKDESSDYYPVPLSRVALRPGTIFADPYGHTLILVRLVPQSGESPGMLLSVDAQPDGTVGIKRFWKGNFLFTTTGVIGEPGFKAFRPIMINEGNPFLMKSDDITAKPGMIPNSLQQMGMESPAFYHQMERIINPQPLDPETALLNLIQALYEQLIVRITSVANGEEYMKSHPGVVIPMPGGTSGVFQAGGLWEDFSTPNRDLRLLIAMDEVVDFPNKILRSPEDFKISILQSPKQVKEIVDALLIKKLSELSIIYTRTNGTSQTLTLGEILNRKDAFEMAYNPNDGIEIRWGAPENSEERTSCKRQVPANQLVKMRSIREWLKKRLHPPT